MVFSPTPTHLQITFEFSLKHLPCVEDCKHRFKYHAHDRFVKILNERAFYNIDTVATGFRQLRRVELET